MWIKTSVYIYMQPSRKPQMPREAEWSKLMIFQLEEKKLSWPTIDIDGVVSNVI